MSLCVRWLTLLGLLLLVAGPAPAEEKNKEKGELADNPFYKHWAGFKPGSTVHLLEMSKLGGQEAKAVPEGTDEKRLTYKLLEVDPRKVVVETVATERAFLGFVQAAPTRHIYPAQVKKAVLEEFLQESGAKKGEDTVKVAGKELKCRTISGTIKGAGGEETEYKLWLSDEVPGHIVKQVRKTRNKGEVVAETTTILQSYKKAE